MKPTTFTARGAWSRSSCACPSCGAVPACPLDQGKERCRREVSGALAGWSFVAVVLLAVLAIGVASIHHGLAKSDVPQTAGR
jgi:hypothetical protein